MRLVCVCLCLCMCMHISCACMHMSACVCMCLHVHVCKHVCTCMCMCEYACMCGSICALCQTEQEGKERGEWEGETQREVSALLDRSVHKWNLPEGAGKADPCKTQPEPPLYRERPAHIITSSATITTISSSPRHGHRCKSKNNDLHKALHLFCSNNCHHC